MDLQIATHYFFVIFIVFILLIVTYISPDKILARILSYTVNLLQIY